MVKVKWCKPKDRSPGRMDVGAADAVILWTKFIGHKDEATLVAQLGRDRVWTYSGGLGGMRNVIEQIAAAWGSARKGG